MPKPRFTNVTLHIAPLQRNMPALIRKATLALCLAEVEPADIDRFRAECHGAHSAGELLSTFGEWLRVVYD